MPNTLTLVQAAEAVRARRVSSRELMAACLARIAARDGEIKAFVRLAPDALAMAERADREPPRGPLHGVPIAIKDLIDTAGLGTECGTPVLAGRVPSRDADCVARLKAAGAIVIGKTATTELAHAHPAPTRNPLDPARTPGGSSSGSAAAVADFMAPAALGTQTGGSIVRPAAFCGLYGFKSSCGRTELGGVQELAGSLDTLGWLARSAEDLTLLGDVLLQPERKAAPLPLRPRIALARTPYDALASAETHATLQAAARAIAPVAEVGEVALPAGFRDLNGLHRRLTSVEAAIAFAGYEERAPEMLSPVLKGFIAEGRANKAHYADLAAEVRAHRATLAAFMLDYDALLVPAAPGEAPIGLESTGDAAFSLSWSLLGVPCATLPFARGPAGLPIGIQLVGRAQRDEELLALVQWLPSRLDAQGQKNVRIAPVTA
jgi:Asp-tRNA(Asn)/Glu-tRNA(Gln) amidotransferase A subunit family amidase